MADETIKRLIELGINAAPAVEELERLRNETRKQTATIDDLSGKLSKFGSVATNLFTLDLARDFAGGVIRGLTGIIDSLDVLVDKSEGLGITIERLQELEHVAAQTGVSSEKLSTALTSLNDKIGNLGNETAVSTKILKAFGVTVADDASTALEKIADAFEKAEDGPTKTAFAVELFGKKLATQMIPLLNQGSAGIQAMRQEAHALGAVINEETVRAAEAFNDDLDKMQKLTFAAAATIAGDMIKALNTLTGMLVANTQQLGFWAGTWQTIMEAVGGTDRERIAANALEAQTRLDALIARKREVEKDPHAAAKWVDVLDKEIKAAEADFRNYSSMLRTIQQQQDKLGAAADAAKAGPPKPLDSALLATGGASGGKSKAKETADAAEKLRRELDPITVLMAKFTEDAAALDRVPAIIDAITANLAALEAAGLGAGTEAELLRRKLIELEATRDPVARATLEIEKMRKAQEENLNMVGALLDLWSRGVITLEEYEAAVARYQKTAADSIKKTTDETKSLAEAVGEFSAKFVTDFIDQLVDGMGRADQSFGDLIENMLKQLAKLMLSRQMQDFLKLVEGGSLFGGTAPAANAAGAAWAGAGVEYMARGGILSRPTFFRSGPRLAVAGEAGPEAVVPLQRTSGGDLGVGASPVIVNVHNNADAVVTEAHRDNADGSRQIDVYIERRVKELIGSGAMDRTMRSTYGLSRQPAAG